MSYIVITRTYLDDQSVKDQVLEMSKESYRIFKKQPGLLDIKPLMSEDNTHLSTFMIWEDQRAHLNCMESKDFASVTAQWTQFIKSEAIRFELETYHSFE